MRCAVFTLNVGNTRTTLAAWRAGRVAARLEWATGHKPPRRLAHVLAANAAGQAPVVLASVVPAYSTALRAVLRELGRKVLVFRKDLTPRIEIVPRPPQRVGDDRIASALGALALDGTRPWVVVDAGTALTVNAVRPRSGTRAPRFEGGLIIPGAGLALRALADGTAQLPFIGA
ncbi:MAG: type III pantothenate kinase, partial [Planctomycetota bacterium]|nr:type III pantothenate kinase [Planctomycetota bacterium]